MTRWEPNAAERLREAAFELYMQHGYEQTTVAEIAARAGLTERTFFRHYADKREVLFGGGERFQAAVVEGAEAAPEAAGPLEAAIAGVEAAGTVFPELAFVRARHELILANPELLERELIKLASLSGALAQALQRRGVAPPTAELAAETGVAVMRTALAGWVSDPAERTWELHVSAAADDLRRLTSEAGVAAHP